MSYMICEVDVQVEIAFICNLHTPRSIPCWFDLLKKYLWKIPGIHFFKAAFNLILVPVDSCGSPLYIDFKIISYQHAQNDVTLRHKSRQVWKMCFCWTHPKSQVSWYFHKKIIITFLLYHSQNIFITKGSTGNLSIIMSIFGVLLPKTSRYA